MSGQRKGFRPDRIQRLRNPSTSHRVMLRTRNHLLTGSYKHITGRGGGMREKVLTIFLRGLIGCCLLAAGGAIASADNFSFQGSFTADDKVQLFHFTVGATSDVVLRTWSYAGGVDAAGDTIPEGGFDPILAVFDSTGAKIGQNDDGDANVPADSVTGSQFDTYLELTTLSAGTYTVSVMEYDNFA